MVDVVGHGSIKITPDGFKFLKEKNTLNLRKYSKKITPKKSYSEKNHTKHYKQR